MSSFSAPRSSAQAHSRTSAAHTAYYSRALPQIAEQTSLPTTCQPQAQSEQRREERRRRRRAPAVGLDGGRTPPLFAHHRVLVPPVRHLAPRLPSSAPHPSSLTPPQNLTADIYGEAQAAQSSTCITKRWVATLNPSSGPRTSAASYSKLNVMLAASAVTCSRAPRHAHARLVSTALPLRGGLRAHTLMRPPEPSRSCIGGSASNPAHSPP
eukprot:1485984-Rhodomonas_salina.1